MRASCRCHGVVNGAAVGHEPSRWRDKDRSGMLAIDAATGSDEATVDALLPVSCMTLGRVTERPSVTDKGHGLGDAPVHHSNTEK